MGIPSRSNLKALSRYDDGKGGQDEQDRAGCGEARFIGRLRRVPGVVSVDEGANRSAVEPRDCRSATLIER